MGFEEGGSSANGLAVIGSRMVVFLLPNRNLISEIARSLGDLDRTGVPESFDREVDDYLKAIS